MAAYTTRTLTIGLPGESVVVPARRVSASLFDVLGVQPAIGRAFRHDDEQTGAAGVVILSDGFWQRSFGGRSDALGQTVRINDEPHIVVGVMPATFHVEQAAQWPCSILR